MFELLSALATLKRLRFRLCGPGTGPYVGSWGVTVLERRTGEVLLSLCHTPDGWCIRPWIFGAGLYKRGSESRHSGQLWNPEKQGTGK